MKSLLAPLVATFVGAVACSGSDASIFPEAPAPSSTAAPQPSGMFGTGTKAACVTSTANGQLAPVDLVFMYDKSGSMGDPAEGFDPTLKWIPVSTGMVAFFDDPGSQGLSASLQFFPIPTNGTLDQVCNAAYATPAVAMTPLTASNTSFVNAIQTTQPAGGTPTLPALEGAIAYAKQLAQAQPQAKAVVVLVTDGDPGFAVNYQFVTGCPNNDIPHVAAAAQAAWQGTPSIPTYVIGVGPDAANLDAIASAGGTGQPIMVDVSDPAQTKPNFVSALNAIRSQVVSCDFGMPPAPAGQTIDLGAVNVILVDASGNQTTIPYDAGCTGGTGWYYDNPSSPTKITLCSGSCTQVQADAGGKVTLTFGCKTSGTIQ